MEWSSEVVMEFLDLYEAETVIWNPLHEHHKDRSENFDAWKRIQNKFSVECSLKELKKKKETLMATYRKLRVKIKNCARNNEVYTPEWFAYDKMASFLNTVYKPRETRSNERHENESDNKYDALDNEDEMPSNLADPVIFSGLNCVSLDEHEQRRLPLRKKRKIELDEHMIRIEPDENVQQKQANEIYHYLKRLADKPKVVKDECYMFCELLCLRLKALDEDTREIAMHEINNLVFHLKTSRKQQPQMSRNYQPPEYLKTYLQQGRSTNRSPIYGSSEGSVPSPAQILSPSATPHGLNGSETEVHCQDVIEV